MTTTAQAVCVLVSEAGSNQTIGSLTLTQVEAGVEVKGSISNLAPGKHGVSVCVAGDLSQGAASCGPIFNPFGKTHGGPGDAQRMVGDLGNVVADESGVAKVDFTDAVASLIGPHSIIGRSLVVYAGEDDRGRGGHENSSTTGNAGPRIAAGVIGLKV